MGLTPASHGGNSQQGPWIVCPGQKRSDSGPEPDTGASHGPGGPGGGGAIATENRIFQMPDRRCLIRGLCAVTPNVVPQLGQQQGQQVWRNAIGNPGQGGSGRQQNQTFRVSTPMVTGGGGQSPQHHRQLTARAMEMGAQPGIGGLGTTGFQDTG